MKPTKDQLAIINARLPGTQLGADSVEVLPFRVFDQKLTDRFTVMSVEMMRKLVNDLDEGRAAFNAMHASRSTLPAGRSVNGKLLSTTEGHELLANMYAVLKRPDGSTFEDGKDIADRYNTGSVFACSAGVQVGFYKCNICGNDIRDWNACDHIPGRQYKLNEIPTTCIATMTGHKIENGMAMDCSIYEVSAVTAGGVANAGVLTETFGKYEDGADAVEFKKSAFEKAETFDRITVAAVPAPAEEFSQPTEESMDGKTKTLEERFEALVRENAQMDGEHKLLKANYELLDTKLKNLTEEFSATTARLEEANTALAATKTEFESAQTELTTLKADNEALAAFKAEYTKLVEEAGNKLQKEGEYDKMSIEDLKSTYEAYQKEIAELPAGRVSTDDTGDIYVASLPAAAFKA